MVRKGEFLERATVIAGAFTLEGLFHRSIASSAAQFGKADLPEPALILPPSPSRGSMEMPLIAELAWALTRQGHSTLRFNYSGVGASPKARDEQGRLFDAAPIDEAQCDPSNEGEGPRETATLVRLQR